MKTYPCLSIRQPWAWLIVNGHKDVENRDWVTPFRGRILIHAGVYYGPRIHKTYAAVIRSAYDLELPPLDQIPLGGIVGAATITDCVRDHTSRWKTPDSWAFVLKNARTLPFVPLKGMLGVFNVPEAAVGAALLAAPGGFWP